MIMCLMAEFAIALEEKFMAIARDEEMIEYHRVSCVDLCLVFSSSFSFSSIVFLHTDRSIENHVCSITMNE